MISRVLKTVSHADNEEILIICHYNGKNIVKNPYSFKWSRFKVVDVVWIDSDYGVGVRACGVE
ncbi:hypothetical protein E2C01_049892 [Portunus trituberculatus]|uniref:Uncharacterized protein n=1 Tax=Portunus trituberculatus TaxID=210409 RepID=A0A5B7GHC1_PORTR|nr:hypothetical protein [Portunus trituberculatus]